MTHKITFSFKYHKFPVTSITTCHIYTWNSISNWTSH